MVQMICSVICLRLGSADESCRCKRIHLPINLCVGEREFILNGTISRQPSFFSFLFMNTHFPIVQKAWTYHRKDIQRNCRIKFLRESIIRLLSFEYMSCFSTVDIMTSIPVIHNFFPQLFLVKTKLIFNSNLCLLHKRNPFLFIFFFFCHKSFSK